MFEMSAITDVTTVAAPFDNQTDAEKVTRRFDVTEENKTSNVTILVNSEVREEIIDLSLRSARWRGTSQFINDALVYYLNTDGDDVMGPHEILSVATWDSDYTLSASITDTVFNQIDLMVKNGHTPWYTKQQFHTCALFSYIEAGLPVVPRR